ncbi:MAG: hypothetical protein AAF539_06225 [Planctomycetota bacterium]
MLAVAALLVLPGCQARTTRPTVMPLHPGSGAIVNPNVRPGVTAPQWQQPRIRRDDRRRPRY